MGSGADRTIADATSPQPIAFRGNHVWGGVSLARDHRGEIDIRGRLVLAYLVVFACFLGFILGAL